MDTRIGQKIETARLALVALAMLSLVLVAALAAPERADAHQTAGRTLIYVDGELVKSTKDDHFTYERRLSPGCHTVQVMQKRYGEVVSQSIRRYCSDERTRLIVTVDDGSVSSKTVARSSDTTSDDA
ncbi:MAG: hypothetical protein M3Q49_10345 [Actinomycetota bacterium]|nr:hypothetical protein [Actinomycetota bacterium]